VSDFIFVGNFALRLTMRPRKSREHREFQAEQRRRDNRVVTLSQVVHLALRCGFEPDANFAKQRRLIAYAPIP
jgi:hypothetical protein